MPTTKVEPMKLMFERLKKFRNEPGKITIFKPACSNIRIRIPIVHIKK